MKRWMTALAGVALLLAGSWTASSAAVGDSEPAQRMDDATSVLQQFVNIPENKIPSALLRQAYGIAVIPSVLKIGFIGGVQHGRGVLSVRTADGKWSDPTFISMTGGSLGFQAGVSSTDIILVFKTQRSINRIADGQFSLGGDASVAAGPVGRSVGASTNARFNAEVYSYSRSRGLFAGASVSGAHIGIDKDSNWLYYNKPGITARKLLVRDSNSLPKSGQRFVYTLSQYMPASSDKFHYRSNGGGDNAQGTGDANSGYNGAGASSGQGAGQGSGQTSPYNDGNNGVTVQQQGSNNRNTAARGSSAQGNSSQRNTSQGNSSQGNTSDYSGNYGNDSYQNNGGAKANNQNSSSGNSGD